MSPPQGLWAVKEATVGRSRRALRELRSVGEGARGKIGSGWELLRVVNQSHSRGGGAPGRRRGGGGEHAQGRQPGGSAKVAPKFPARDQPLSQQDRDLPA